MATVKVIPYAATEHSELWNLILQYAKKPSSVPKKRIYSEIKMKRKLI